MFYGKSKIKLCNYFALSDAAATTNPPDRRTLRAMTGLSPVTVSRALENLLDLGIFIEHDELRPAKFSLNSEMSIIIIDLSHRDFHFSLCELSGKEISSFTYKLRDEYFFDENISLFLKTASVKLSKMKPEKHPAGASVITPPADNSFGTMSVLKSEDRLIALIKESFNVRTAEFGDRMSYALRYAESALANKTNGILCVLSGRQFLCSLSDRISRCVLKSESHSNVAELIFRGESESASLASALGNICGVTDPEYILIDSDGYITDKNFSQKFIRALNLYTDRPSPIIISDTDSRSPVMLGAICAARHNLIKELLDSDIGFNDRQF